MKFVSEHKSRMGVVTTIFAIALCIVAGSRAADAPTMLGLKTDRSASLIRTCLESPDGQRIFGKLSRAPVGNPLFGRRLNSNHFLYFTSQKHKITIHAGQPTLVTVAGPETLTQDQVRFVQACSDPTVMW